MALGCKHVAGIDQHVKAKTPTGCEECIKSGARWVHLRMCKNCGHIGCCDDSPNQHARKHFTSTSGPHPIIQSFEPGEEWGWCYVDEKELNPAVFEETANLQRRGHYQDGISAGVALSREAGAAPLSVAWIITLAILLIGAAYIFAGSWGPPSVIVGLAFGYWLAYGVDWLARQLTGQTGKGDDFYE